LPLNLNIANAHSASACGSTKKRLFPKPAGKAPGDLRRVWKHKHTNPLPFASIKMMCLRRWMHPSRTSRRRGEYSWRINAIGADATAIENRDFSACGCAHQIREEISRRFLRYTAPAAASSSRRCGPQQIEFGAEARFIFGDDFDHVASSAILSVTGNNSKCRSSGALAQHG